jgi:multicomponent Na+:H+ antiporter subunit E
MNSLDLSRVALCAALARAAAFFAFWLILTGFRAADLVVGILAAILATLASLRLMPPAPWRFRPIKLTKFVFRFFRQSITAGIDVAWRALDPRMPLQPGFVTCLTQMPEGPTLSAFCTISSLLPGTLPCGHDAGGGLVIHCLDVTQPVADQLAAEEALFIEAFGKKPSDA